MIINTQTVKKSSGGNNNYSVLGGILDDNELIYPSTKTPAGTVLVPSNNPADYTKVDWLGSTTATNVIDTNIPMNTIGSGSIECEFSCDRTVPRGISGGFSPNAESYQFYCNETEIWSRWRSQTYKYANSDNNFHKIGASPTKLYVDNNVMNINESALTKTDTILLFARHNYMNISDYMIGKIKYLWTKNTNNQYTHNLLPCYHTTEGYRVYFDAVSMKAYYGGFNFEIPSDTSGEINLAEYLASLT